MSDEISLKYAWYVVAVLVPAQAFSFLDRMIMSLLVGPIRESFQMQLEEQSQAPFPSNR